MKFSNKEDQKRYRMVLFINSTINDKVLARKIEQSIYNYIIEISKEKNIQRTWNNPIFTNIYRSKILSIYS